MDFLIGELSGRIEGLVRVENNHTSAPGCIESGEIVTVHLHDLEGGWCHIELNGDARGISIVVKLLTGHKSLEKVLVWDCDHLMKEYSYTLFCSGKILEQFSVKGPVLDSVSFFSELRKVQLPDLIQGYDFAMEAIGRFGIHPDAAKGNMSRHVRLEFPPPPKPSIWRSLLGSLSGGE